MLLTLMPGYPDLIGRRAAFVGTGTGPTSYTGGTTGGDPITIPGKYLDVVLEVPQDPTGTYYAVARPSFAGPRATWVLRYYATSNSVEVSNSTNLSAVNFVVSGFYGEY